MNVRTAKEKIDTQRERGEKGFNVKLGRGGIREIEFIAQALQVAFGGRDPWLRAAHTLISLGRLADRGLIGKASTPVRLTKRSNIVVEELAFFHLGDPKDGR